MNKIKWLAFAILIASVVLGVVACGGTKATTVPKPGATQVVAASATNTPLPKPTATTEPTAEPDATLDVARLSLTTDLQSYRSSTTITLTGTKSGKQVEESIDVKTEYTRDPKAQHISMTTSSTEQPTQTGTIEIYTVEGMQYTKMGEQWISSPMTDTSQLEQQGVISAMDMINDACGWKNQGKESLDGVRVQHWTLPKAGAEKCFAAIKVYEKGELTDAGGDLYIVIDGNYIAKMDLFFVGKGLNILGGTAESALLDEGRSDINYTMSDVNQPITIEVPEAALQASALPEDIPIPPDAEGASQTFGMITFSSPSTPKQISDFYQAEMPNYGWTAGDVQEFSGMYTLGFTKESRTASFLISTDQSGKTTVLITVQEQ